MHAPKRAQSKQAKEKKSPARKYRAVNPKTKNKFCSFGDLGNEASVEQFFVSRLLSDLGYRDRQIKPKTSLDELTVNKGRKKVKYKPDYALKIKNKIRWIVEAKGVQESLDEFVGQCSGYCLGLNSEFEDENPVEFFLITNGHNTRLYRWDNAKPLLELGFEDFQDGNSRYDELKAKVAEQQFSVPTTNISTPVHELRRESLDEINAAFAWCHQFIYKKDNLSQSAAFMEFVKIVFLKLLSDKEIHKAHPDFASQKQVSVPATEVKFSKRWLEDRENDHPNPLDALQFQALLESLEEAIQQGKKKRIFDSGEHISLSADTIKGVVERLENIDLFGIDADLNGRLFETFLNATMRGRDLGQYFTPRSVVKLAVKLAKLRATREHMDVVIDACCGTGGFLIDVLAEMWSALDKNTSLTDAERGDLKNKVATEQVYGIDVAKDPPLARIARMNMYLHGDGGSRIYQADALDKGIAEAKTDSPEQKRDKKELRSKLHGGNFADVVLTNPPFAKEYNRKYPQDARVLDEYALASEQEGGANRKLQSLKSSVMFLERYHDILKPGGTLITVIDDSILGGDRYGRVRDYIREKFIVRAVVSLPGDAFQRSKARVKTSLISLQKKRTPEEAQPPVFMYYCTSVGIDDSPRQRVLPIDRVNRENARKEIEEAGRVYEAYLSGAASSSKWTVEAKDITDRMDVKNCLPKPGRKLRKWKKDGYTVLDLAAWLEPVSNGDETDDANKDIIDTATSEDLVTHLRVRYDGFAEAGDEIYASDSKYPRLYRVHTGDVVISHINAVNGAIAVVPPELDGLVVTSEYTVCRAKEGIDPRLVWMLLRAPECRADLLLLATGIGRNRVRWEHATSLRLPTPKESLVSEVVAALKQAEEQEATARKLRLEAQGKLEKALDLDGKMARTILAAFKPPR